MAKEPNGTGEKKIAIRVMNVVQTHRQMKDKSKTDFCFGGRRQVSRDSWDTSGGTS